MTQSAPTILIVDDEEGNLELLEELLEQCGYNTVNAHDLPVVDPPHVEHAVQAERFAISEQ